MSDTISRQAAIEALFELYEYQRDIDPTEAADLVRQGIFLAEKKIEKLPSAQPEHMHTVMLKIKEKYEKAMNTPCINNPMAWALYQTWKEYDR